MIEWWRFMVKVTKTTERTSAQCEEQSAELWLEQGKLVCSCSFSLFFFFVVISWMGEREKSSISIFWGWVSASLVYRVLAAYAKASVMVGGKGDKKRRSKSHFLLLLFLSLMFHNVPRFTKHEKSTGDLESSDCVGIITNGKPTRCMKTVFQKTLSNKEERERTKELLILKIRLCFLHSWAAMSRAFSSFFFSLPSWNQ